MENRANTDRDDIDYGYSTGQEGSTKGVAK